MEPMILIVILIVWLLILPGSSAPCSSRSRPEPEPRGLHVVKTEFHNEAGLVAVGSGEGNILGPHGPYRKCFVWSDGRRVWESNPEWTDRTWGSAGRLGL